jgi:crotonobetainyl-CoA:carnitine CoA-transferase CaiB-like acyl-CoA transferase
MIAGPTTSRTLGDWGADVIKIENYNGDTLRPLGMNLLSPTDDDENPTFHIANSNKRMIPVNIKTKEGQEIVHKLVSEADVFITSLRKDALVRVGLDYETISEKYPRLIYAHVLGYGEAGPLKDRAAFDFSTYFARSGFMNIIADSQGPPPINSPAFGDNQLALSLLAGINMALYNREKTGKGDYVHASLYHMGIYTLGFVHAADYYEQVYPLTHSDPQSPLVTVYKCSDGEWLYLASPDYITYFPKVCDLLGLHELGQDEEYNDIMGMLMHKIEIRDMLQAEIIKKTAYEWAELFAGASIPAERIFSSKDVREDEQVYANDFMKWVTHGNGKKSPMATTPTRLRSMGNGFDYEFLPGGIGAEAKEILAELGYNEQDMLRLKEEGIINFGEFL